MKASQKDQRARSELTRTLRAVENCRHILSGQVLWPLDITLEQGEILLYLYRNPTAKIETSELLEVLQVTRSSLSSTLKKMKQKGYIHYFSGGSDERKKQVTLTVKAMEVQKTVTKKLQDFEAAIYNHLEDSECVQAQSILVKILQNMSEITAANHSEQNKSQSG